MDLVLCHNVLIYFSESQIRKSIRLLTDKATINGWLSISAIEASIIDEAHLTTHRYPGAVFFKKTLPLNINRQETQPAKTLTDLHLNPKNTQPAFPLPSTPQNLPVSTTTPILANRTELVYEECYRLYRKKAYPEVIALLLPLLLPIKTTPLP